MLVILCGLPFSGKSALAQIICTTLPFIRIDLDEVKFRLLGKGVHDEQITQGQWDAVYQQMYQDIREGLVANKNIVHDTGNFTTSERNIVRAIAQNFTVPTLTIFVDTPLEVIHKRLVQNRLKPTRFDVSDENLLSCVKEMEPPGVAEPSIVFKPKDSLENLLTGLKSGLNLL